MRRDLASITEKPWTYGDELQYRAAELRYSMCQRYRLPGLPVLEVGCGAGWGLSLLGDFGPVAGLDASHANAVTCRDQGIPVCQGDAMMLPIRDTSVGLVACLEVIYYLPSLSAFLAEVRRVLVPGGRVVISWPNPRRPAFSPSPGATSYPSPTGLSQELTALGFTVDLFGCFPVSGGVSSPLVENARRLASTLRLIPRTMEGRSRLKRLLGRGSARQMRTVRISDDALNDLVVLTGEEDDFVMLYAVGTLGGPGARGA